MYFTFIVDDRNSRYNISRLADDVKLDTIPPIGTLVRFDNVPALYFEVTKVILNVNRKGSYWIVYVKEE